MERLIRSGALAVMLVAPAAQGWAADCWLLGRQELNQAHRQGACRDAFARDTWESAAVPQPQPQLQPPPSPPRDPVETFVQGIGQDFRTFVNDLDRDLRSVTRSLSSVESPSGTPPHTTPGR